MAFIFDNSKAMGNPLLDALQWHIDNGVDVAIEDAPQNRLVPPVIPSAPANMSVPDAPAPVFPQASAQPVGGRAPLAGGFTREREKAIEAAKACMTLDALKDAIRAYDGLEVKRTATNLVFADGNPQAHVMVIGEAPGADEDRQGLPFVGVSGQLLDRMFDCIGLSRKKEAPDESLYISNILNWRPPGNRTPTESEIALALPFIERHIAIVRPRFVVVAGAVAAKSILDMNQPISRLRGKLYAYKPVIPGINDGLEPFESAPKILPTYHPSFLLRTPVQKGKAWADLLMLADALNA